MPVKNTLVFYFIPAILAVLGVNSDKLWLIILAVYLAVTIVKVKTIRPVLLLVVSCFFLVYGYFHQIENNNYENIEGVVESIEANRAVVATKSTKILVYFDKAAFDNDDIVSMTLAPLTSTVYKNPGAFDYPGYLKTQGISQSAWMESVEVIEKRTGLKDLLARRFQEDSLVNSYSKMFILGVKDDNIDSTGMVELSIIHLFALSGMHLEYLRDLIKKIVGYFVDRSYLDGISYILIGTYLFNIPLNIAFTRAFGVGLFHWLFKDRLNRLDCLALVGLIFLLKNPYVIFSLSFIFSFAVYFILLLLGKCKFSDFLLYLGSVPLIIAVNYRVNLLGMVLAIILGPFVRWFYILLLVNAIMGGWIGLFADVFISTFENIMALATHFSLFLNFGSPGPAFLVAYYICYFALVLRINANLKIKNDIIALVGLTLGYSLFLTFSPVGQVVMIDVGQGDSFLIKQPFNRGNILIDTGGNTSFDLAGNVTVPYMRSLGVFDLDCVILSHDDYDHSGAYESLGSLMPIGDTIREHVGMIVVGDLRFDILELPVYGNKNDNSLVVHVNINNLDYLFLGDVSKEVEERIVEDYPDLEVDVIKVGHHGSPTSTSESLIRATRPKLALISVGADNPYNHPSVEVVSLLESYGSMIHRTDIDGSLTISYLPFSRNYLFPYRSQL